MKLRMTLSCLSLAIAVGAFGCGGGSSSNGGGGNNNSGGGNNNSVGSTTTSYNDTIQLSNGQTGTLAIVLPSSNSALGTLVVSAAAGKAGGTTLFPAGTYLISGTLVNGLINFTGSITQDVFNLNGLNPSVPVASAFDLVYGGLTYPGTATTTHVLDVETWPLQVVVIGPSGGPEISVSYAGYPPTNGPPEGGGYPAGGPYILPVTGVNDEHYTVFVPSNQPDASGCTITSGATGYLGSWMPTVVVNCN